VPLNLLSPSRFQRSIRLFACAAAVDIRAAVRLVSVFTHRKIGTSIPSITRGLPRR
jgi:hypothetical protein